MWLTTEELGDVHDVMRRTWNRILSEASFGKFAILSASQESFIQASNAWQSTAEYEAFFKAHGSDPWVLEYRDGASGRQYAVRRPVTLDEVRRAFASYLHREPVWRTWFEWEEVRT